MKHSETVSKLRNVKQLLRDFHRGDGVLAVAVRLDLISPFLRNHAAADQHARQGERSVAELFREQGLNVNTRVNKSKWAGIQRVKMYLEPRVSFDAARWPEGKPSLFIFRTCPMMIREIKKYRWKQDGDEPVKCDDHAMDELRYYLMSRPAPQESGKGEDSIVVKHKKKLAARQRSMRQR